MKSRIVIAVALLLLGAGVKAQDGPLPVEEIAPGNFVHIGTTALMTRSNQGAIANVGFIIGNDSVAVIDTGGSVREGKALLESIRMHTDKPIRYVINTHGHPDHVFGNAAFRNAETVFVGHKNLSRALASRGPFYLSAFRRIMGNTLIDDVRLIPPDRVVEDRTVIDLGGRSLELRAWPTAHSDSDLTVFDESTETLYAGDLVFVTHIPVVDGSILGWLKVMDEMSSIPARRVVPGHGAPGEWPAALTDQRRYLTTLAADVRGMIARGTPITVAARSAAETERTRWELFDDYNARNATAAFSEIEWE